MINPYEGVNFNACIQLPSLSHCHCTDREKLSSLYADGTRHFALSNYYPSKPYYPLADFFENVPSDAIGCPNAEHHNMLVDGTMIPALHINSLGSTFSSNPDSLNTGVNADWKATFDNIFKSLLFAGGGGITINHPKWTDGFTQVNMSQMIRKMLDYDSRVLGIEIYNHSCMTDSTFPETGYAIDYWDAVLKTGRRCWGFAVPDHHSYGRNILLVENATEQECLEAYRKGRFYARLKNSDLAFTNLSFANNVLTVQTNGATSIDVVVNGVHTTHSGASCTQAIDGSAIYVRVEAKNGDDEIYSNPIILKEYTGKKRNNIMMWY